MARHQTGHNSGVIHSGHLLRARQPQGPPVQGGAQCTKDFCTSTASRSQTCGKLIVATDDARARPDGRTSSERAGSTASTSSGVDAAPSWASGSPTSSASARSSCARPGSSTTRRYAGPWPAVGRPRRARRARGRVDRHTRVAREVDGRRPATGTPWTCDQALVACAGLQADRLARLAGLDVDFQIVPFRGEYYRLPADAQRHRVDAHLPGARPRPAVPRRAPDAR